MNKRHVARELLIAVGGAVCGIALMALVGEHAGVSAIHADVSWHCINCEGERGEPIMSRSLDGSRRLGVTG